MTLPKAVEKAVEKSVKRAVTAPPHPHKVTPADVDRLVRFDGHGARVLSAYLDLDPERQVTRSFRIVFEDLVKAAREGLDKAGRLELEAEAAKVRAWLEAKQPGGLGLATFSSMPADLWQAWFLPISVLDRLSYEPHPLVIPLLALIEDHERYVVAVVDKESARLLTVFEGVIESRQAFTDFVPGKHDQGGPAQARYQRHHETHVLWHVKRVVQQLSELLRNREFDRLILAGPEEATTELCEQLPHELQRRLVATVPAEMDAGDAVILRMTQQIEQRVERDSEAGLVTELIDAWKANGNGVCGIAPTSDALYLRQVNTLVIAEGLTVAGSECPVDSRLEPGRPEECPMCGAEMTPVGDLIDRAAHQTLEQDGRVEIAHEAAAERLRAECDGIGAVLRFRLHG